VKEWRRVAPELHRLGLLGPFEAASFAAYCQHFAVWIAAERALSKSDLVVKSSGRTIVNPLARTARTACSTMVKVAREFSMTPRSRLGVGIAPRPKEPSKFDGLVGD
jgi:P27 family predicted phage terminase small subunit